jgi:hypothetical protein
MSPDSSLIVIRPATREHLRPVPLLLLLLIMRRLQLLLRQLPPCTRPRTRTPPPPPSAGDLPLRTPNRPLLLTGACPTRRSVRALTSACSRHQPARSHHPARARRPRRRRAAERKPLSLESCADPVGGRHPSRHLPPLRAPLSRARTASPPTVPASTDPPTCALPSACRTARRRCSAGWSG